MAVSYKGLFIAILVGIVSIIHGQSTDASTSIASSTVEVSSTINIQSTGTAATPISESTGESSTPGTSATGPTGTYSTESATSGTTGTATTGAPNTNASPASSQKPASNTPTPSQISSTITTPKVNVNYIQFTFSCNASVTQRENSCVYYYDLPKNYDRKGWLMTEQSIIDTDQIKYDNLTKNVSDYEDGIKAVNDDAQAKMQALRDQLAAIQAKVTDLQQKMAMINGNITKMQSNIIYASQYLNSLKPGNCYFDNCMARTTKKPTTTSSPSPTTPSDICTRDNRTCDNYSYTGGNNTCTPKNGQPYCIGCVGNLDGYQWCEQSSCVSGNGLQIQFGTGKNNAFPIWSPGYTPTEVLGYNASMNCVWKLQKSDPNNKFCLKSGTLNVAALDPGSQLMIIYNDHGDSISINNQTKERALSSIFGSNSAFSIQFNSGPTRQNASFFAWELFEIEGSDCTAP